MKKRIAAILTAILAAVLGLAIFAACSPEGGGSGVTISQTEATIEVGGTVRLTAAAGDGSKVSWTTSDAKVATVTAGIVRGVSVGTATITATAGGNSATCLVTVDELTVTLSETSLQMERYSEKTLTATVKNGKGETVTGSSVNWTSSEPSVASVDASGKVTAVKEGTATITATRAGGTSHADCQVTVIWSDKPAGYYEMKREAEAGAVNNPGHWSYDADTGYGGSTPTVVGEGTDTDSNLTISFEGNTGWRWYGIQVFYKNADLVERGGKVFKLTFTITSDHAGSITVNNNDVDVIVGDTPVEIYYTEPAGGASVNIKMATHDKLHDNVNPIEQISEAHMTFKDLAWEEVTPTALQAPGAFAIASDGQLQITDPNPLANMEGYIIGFFADDAAKTPLYTQVVMNPAEGRPYLETMKIEDGKMYLDDSFVPKGTYTVKCQVYPASPKFTSSPWSTGVTYEVKTDRDYSVTQTYRDADRGMGRFYVWSEWNQFNLEACSFKGNTLTLTLTGEADWYSNQVYYSTNELENDHIYKASFKFSAKDADGKEADLTGKEFIINGQRIHPTKGEQTIEFTFLYQTGAQVISMSLGKPNENFSATVPDSGLAAGTYTFSDITFKDLTKPVDGDAMFFGEDVSGSPDKLGYWYAVVGDWAEWNATMVMNDLGSEANEASDTKYSYTFDYDITPLEGQWNGVCPWIFRLFYKNSKLVAGTSYKLSLTIDSSAEGDIIVNNQTIHLTEGEQTIRLYYVEGNGASLEMKMATDTSMLGKAPEGSNVLHEHLVIKSLNWVEGQKSNLKDLTGSVATDGTVTFTDPNNKEGVDRYEIGLFDANGTQISTQTIVNSGEKINDTLHVNGQYTVKIRACGDADHNDSGWINIGSYTVTNGTIYRPGGAEEAAAVPGVWHVWLDHYDWCGSQATVKRATCDMDTKLFKVEYETSGTPSLGYSVQFFMDNPELTVGKVYTLKVTLELSVTGTITLMDNVIELKANQPQEVTVNYMESAGDGAGNMSFSMQMGVYAGEGSTAAANPVMNAEISISNWSWTELTSSPNGEEYDIVYTEKGENDIPPDSTFYYWSEFKKLTGKYDHGTVKVHLESRGNWYSDQIYFCLIDIPDGTYTFTMKIHSSAAGEVRINGKIFALVAGDNDITVEGSGKRFSMSLGAPAHDSDFNVSEWGSGTDARSLMSGDLELSDFKWTSSAGTYGVNGKIS